MADICRRHRISDQNGYNWKSQHGGMEFSDSRRMKGLEAELSQYKRKRAELARENDAMRELIEKSSGATRATRGGKILGEKQGLLAAGRSCRYMGLSRSAYYREPAARVGIGIAR
jgi:putative transposase